MSPSKTPKTPRKPRHSLDGVFRPKSVAVIGASGRPGAIGYQVVANLVNGGFTGPVYPVNSRAPVVMSMPTYPSVTKIPGPVDLAVIVVPAAHVLNVARECGRKGVKGLVVITAGFKETGGEGVDREAELMAIAEKHGMRVIGPNCMGIINTEVGVNLNASFAWSKTPPGPVAMVSQSGALGEAILADSAAAGLGVSMFASVGNRADITAADLMEYWEDDPNVGIILLYIESMGNSARFLEVARRVSRKKPILAVKSGRSAAGAAAAGSHTGSVAGADAAAEVLFEQCGVLRVGSFRQMFALTAALLHQPLPKGDRVAIVTNAGGPAILATDALDGLGLEIAELSPKTTTALEKFLPKEASSRNPVDLIASADADRYSKTLRAVAKDPGVDALLVMFVSPAMIDAEAVAKAIVKETRGVKTTLACIMGRSRGNEAIDLLRQEGVPVFRYPEDAAKTMQQLMQRVALAKREHPPVPRLRVRRKVAAEILDDHKGGWLSAEQAETVLHAYGLNFAAAARVKTPGDAVAAARKLGYPVVLKAEAPGLLHKSEFKAVVTGLDDGDAVFAAADDLKKRLGKQFRGLKLIVQAKARGHREILLGATRDERYGPILAAGLGGTHVEVLRDVAVRIAPMDAHDPREMFESLKGAVLFGAFRGEPRADLDVACDALLRIQQLVLDFPRIAEVEINPFMLAAPGEPSLAVDARLRLLDA